MSQGPAAGATNEVYGVIDLFAGCGGLTQGFVTASATGSCFVPVGAVELDPFAAATYSVNFGPHVFQGDIADWIGTDLPEADVVIGGPPCQGFSSLGKQDPDDERNKLWQRYAEVVAAVRPAYFVLENVPPFLNSRQYAELVAKTRHGMLGDYTVDQSPLIVTASDYGAAQKRRRAVVIGRRRDLPPIDLAPRMRTPRTVRNAIGHTATIVHPRYLPDRSIRVEVANRTLEVPGTFTTTDLHITRSFTELSKQRYRAIGPGGNRHDLPEHLRAPCWVGNDSGSHDVMGRLHWDRPSVTIRTEFWKPEKGRYLHPVAHRPITHMEAALLQGFPEDFRWCGTKISIGRQIGNAVPVELARAIAESILVALRDAGERPRGGHGDH